MTRDLKTTIIGAVLTGLSAIQPAMNAFEGTFHAHDVIQLAFGFAIAALGYYIGKVDPKP